ncbi:MAG TPA: hypothetical protein EYN06_01780 [Myxococcales bacterium]|nr:hypothetical protein [Myxococcales bacterium]
MNFYKALILSGLLCTLIRCGGDQNPPPALEDATTKSDASSMDTSPPKELPDPCIVFEACAAPGTLSCFDGSARECVENTNNGCVYWSDPIPCDDQNPCTSDQCVDGDGCTYAFNTGPCDSQSQCTALDQCLNGECIAGPERLFAANFPNAGSQGLGIVQDNNGDIFIAGTQMEGGWPNARLIALNAVGELQWEQTYKENFGALEGVAVVGEKIVAAGRKGTTQDSALWMIQVDKEGTSLWSRVYSKNEGPDSINAVVALDDEALVLVGVVHSNNAQNGETWAAQSNAAGDLIWEKNLDDGPGFDQANDVAVRPAGGVAIVGHTTNGSGNKANARLIVLDELGDVLVDQNYGGNKDDKAHGVLVLPSNDILIVGEPNAWLIQTDPEGAVIWQRKYGDNPKDRLDAVIQLNDGELALGGSWQDNAQGARLILTNEQGHLMHEYSFATDSGRKIRGMVATAKHDLLLAGIANEGVWAARSGYWGHTQCKEAGKCAKLTPATCSLENPCESPLCDPALGCLDEANTLPCELPDECSVQNLCDKKSCQAGPDKLFEKSYGNGDDESTVAAAKVSESGIGILVKYSAMAGGRVIRVDNSGSQLWSHSLDEVDKFHPAAMVARPDDGFVIVGKVTSNSEGSDAAALVIGPDGGVQKLTVFGGDGQQGLEAVAERPNGTRVYAGWTDSAGAGYFDAWLVFADATGKVLDSKTFGTQAEERMNDIAIQKNGDILMAGFGNITGDNDFRLVRTTANGDYLWQKTYGEDGDDEAHALVALPDNGALLVGSTQNNTGTHKNVLLIRVDNVGKQLWKQTYGGTQDDWATDVILMPDGGFAIAATTHSQGAGESDSWLIRTDKDGKPKYNRSYGGTGSDLSASLLLLSDNGFAIAGTLTLQGLSVPWLMRTDPFGNPDCAARGSAQN